MSPKRKRWLVAVGSGLLAVCLGIAMTNAFSKSRAGLIKGQLAPCPDSPNCVCSLAEDPRHVIQPLSFSGDATQAWQRLQEILQETPRARIIVNDERYLHAEFTTALLRFVDDVEFTLNREESRIDVRSCSRVGYSDLGANRKRIERLRTEFDARQSP